VRVESCLRQRSRGSHRSVLLTAAVCTLALTELLVLASS
jgi:hypothetical protein